MGFLIGAGIGLGALLVLRAVTEPHEVTVNLRKYFPYLVAAAAGGTIAYLISNSALIALCVALLAGAIPVGIVRHRQRRRRQALREAWPEVLDEVVASVRAGLGVGEALSLLEVRGPQIVRTDFAEFATHLRAVGRLNPCLDELKAKMADPMADRIIEAMRLSHDLGGRDLAKMLTNLAAYVREDNRARGELLARQSWTVNGARLAAVAPWLILLLFSTRPGTSQAFANPTGAVVLITGLVLTVVAYLLMLRLGRLPEEKRILDGADA
ncbi:MAG: type II secretion system F family protein [Trueperella sp.]|nr:type II secretion system F family protein [Trueperella sp.]